MIHAPQYQLRRCHFIYFIYNLKSYLSFLSSLEIKILRTALNITMTNVKIYLLIEPRILFNILKYIYIFKIFNVLIFLESRVLNIVSGNYIPCETKRHLILTDA